MASLHAPVTIAAAAHGDIETSDDGPPDDLLLILGFAAFPLHTAAAMRAVLRQRNRDPFIHPRWDGAARLPAVAAAGFAAWAPRVGFGVTARMRRSLPLVGAQGGFQFPAQPLCFLLQPLVLFAEPIDFLLRLVQIPFRNKLDALGLPVWSGPTDWFHPTLR